MMMMMMMNDDDDDDDDNYDDDDDDGDDDDDDDDDNNDDDDKTAEVILNFAKFRVYRLGQFFNMSSLWGDALVPSFQFFFARSAREDLSPSPKNSPSVTPLSRSRM